jgi:hypothetical protein
MDDTDLAMDVAPGESQPETMEFDIDYNNDSTGADAPAHDAEMEVQDPAEEVEVDDMREAMLEGDAEMAAELHEQEMKSDERDWLDTDAKQHLVDTSGAPEASATEGNMHADGTEGLESETSGAGDDAQLSARNGEVEGDHDDLQASPSEPVAPHDPHEGPNADEPIPMTKASRDSQAEEVEAVQYDPDEEGNAVAEVAAEEPVGEISKPVNEAGDEHEERYADV